MPLDPQVKQMLDQLAAQGGPPLEQLTPQEARAQMLASSAALGPFETVAQVYDRRIPGPHGQIPIRVYQPAASGPLPVVVFFHGGGWVCGSIDTHDGHCRAVANAAEALVVSVDYRLAPEHRFPAAQDDAYAATWWVAEHARELGGDPRRLTVMGDSAGGNLAAAVALLARDRGSPPIAFQLLIYPVMDHDFETASYRENGEGCYLTRNAMIWFWRQYLARPEDARRPYASPLSAAELGGLPPALIITAEYDPLRDEAEAYAHRLREAGVEVTLTRYPGMIHGFVRRLHFFDQARAALWQVAGALRVQLSA